MEADVVTSEYESAPTARHGSWVVSDLLVQEILLLEKYNYMKEGAEEKPAEDPLTGQNND